jgi:hypothetical protein
MAFPNQQGTDHGGRHWVNGVVDTLNRKTDTIQIGKDTYSIRDVPKHLRSLVSIGDRVTLWFDTTNHYYATSMSNHTMEADKFKNGKSIPVGGGNTKKTVEDYRTLIKDTEPFYGEMELSDSEKREVRSIYEGAIDQSIKLFDITATYDDTKKDIVDLVDSILEAAAVMTIVIDCNSSQILKRGLPKEPEEKK